MKTRTIAAFALLPLLLLVVLWAHKLATAILFGVLAAIAAYELLTGTGIVRQARLVIYSALAAVFVAMWSYFGFAIVWMQLAVLVFFVLLFAEMMMDGMKLGFEKVAVCFVAGFIVPLLFTSLVRIHKSDYGRFYVLIPFVLAFLSDTGAYFVGCAFGKHKLAPTISPKKSIEGVFGGIFGAILGMVLYCLVLNKFFSFNVSYIYAIIYGLLGSVGAVFGDLCFSVIKRQTGIKDYGNLIPGHGGILDRFDSMMIVGPLAELLLIFIPVAV